MNKGRLNCRKITFRVMEAKNEVERATWRAPSCLLGFKSFERKA
jgi:hypothetical protein